MKYLIPLTIYTLFFLASCDTATPRELAYHHDTLDYVIPSVPKELADNANDRDDETTISVPIKEYTIRISREEEEKKQAKLSDQNIKELKYWWDSLPQPLQSEIKSNKVDIEVLSEITTTDEYSINSDLNDSQIENTGETLEQIIGVNTEMKYTVSTILIDDYQSEELDQHTTNIRLVKKVPVKLKSFTTDVFLRQKDVSNQNITSLQYWWTSLPEDIQYKIKTQELTLDLTCHTIDDGLDVEINKNTFASANDKVVIMADILDKLIGVYQIGKKQISIAEITTNIQMEKATIANAQYPAKQYVKINIRKNKNFIPTL